jgi:predicted transcriptional regulator
MSGMDRRVADGFRDRLLAVLGELDVSARRFALDAGIDVSTMYKMTAGWPNTSVATLERICRTHGISADWLLFGVGDWRLR